MKRSSRKLIFFYFENASLTKSCEIPEGHNFNAVHSSSQWDELLLGTITAQISAWHMKAIEDLNNISE